MDPDAAAERLRRIGCDVLVGAEIILGHSQYGKTDIIATRGNSIAVVECKFINGTNAICKKSKIKQ